MTKEELIKRIKKFVIDVLRLCEKLPKTTVFNIFTHQLIRCTVSIGANYRAACRAKSSADFINKLKIVEEESDESIYFLELIFEFDKENSVEIKRLIKEANELLSIFVSSIKTTRENQSKTQR